MVTSGKISSPFARRAPCWARAADPRDPRTGTPQHAEYCLQPIRPQAARIGLQAMLAAPEPREGWDLRNPEDYKQLGVPEIHDKCAYITCKKAGIMAIETILEPELDVDSMMEGKK